MTDPSKSSARARAYRAWEFTRPFVNATLVLAIVLVVAMLWFVDAAQSLVDDTLNDVKFGLIEELDDDAKLLMAEIRKGVAEFDTLRADIARIADHPADLIDPQIRHSIKAVENDANRIAHDLDRIASGHVDLSQESLERIAVSLVRAYSEIRGCTGPSTTGSTVQSD